MDKAGGRKPSATPGELEVIYLLRKAAAEAGSVRKLAKLHGVNQGLLSRTLSGDAPLAPAVAKIVGFARVCRWVRTEGGAA